MKPAERAVLVLIVVAIAIALRWGFVATSHQPNPLRADAGQYAQYAHNLVEHGVYSFAEREPPPPDSFRSPGFPVFAAVCRLCGGESWVRLLWGVQVALSGLTVLLGYLLARRFLDFWPSFTAAVLMALSPHLVTAPTFVLTECLTTFVLTLGLWLWLGSAGEKVFQPRRVLGALVLGYASLCNEVLLFVPFVLGFVEWRAHGLRSALPLAVIALLPFCGWTVRNQTTELERVGSARATASISHGSYPGMVWENPRLRGFPYHEDPAQPEFGASWQGLYDVLSERVAAEPWRYASWYVFEKPVWLWGWEIVQGVDVYVYELANSPYDDQPVMRASYLLMKWLHWPVMILAAVGAVALAWNPRRRFGPEASAVGLVVVTATLAYLPVIPDPRYLQPFRPLVFVLTGAAAFGLVRALRGSTRRRQDDVTDAGGEPLDEIGQVAEAQ